MIFIAKKFIKKYRQKKNLIPFSINKKITKGVSIINNKFMIIILITHLIYWVKKVFLFMENTTIKIF